ncbi:MAG: alkylmercury lyase [Candidatus Tectimicrobiota bacterium]|nr:MAG: alkylmercury lyase [Candidatus Tectomicrobia bacterium]
MTPACPGAADRLSQLLATLPRYCPAEQRFALQLYRRLATGEPVPRAALAAEEALWQRFAGRLRDDAAGRVVAFGGLSLLPTAHRMEVAGRLLYAWCAWDTLFLPALLQQPARVTSSCAVTATPVCLEVTPQRLARCQPASAVVSFVVPAAWEGDVVAAFCCHVRFFRDLATGRQGLASHPEAWLLPVAEAFALGQRKVALQFDAVALGQCEAC